LNIDSNLRKKRKRPWIDFYLFFSSI
jgi:hypothetical protein